MNWFSRASGAPSPDDDLSEEIRAHLEEKTDQLVAGGMSRADARAAARRAFGNVGGIREQGHDVWHWPPIESLMMDVRYALRLVRRQRGFSASVMLIAALAIAGCATTFSLVSGILLAPLPFAAPERVFDVAMRSTEGSTTVSLPAAVYAQIASGSPVINAIASSASGLVTVDWSGEPERLRARPVTASFFDVFGVSPILGRTFTADEAEQSLPVVLLGYEVWRTRFNRDSSVIGRRVVMNDIPYTVVGVLPPKFRAAFAVDPDVWVPLRVRVSADGRAMTNATVRLADGVTQHDAEAWLGGIADLRLRSRTGRDSVAAALTLIPVSAQIYGDVEQPLHVLLVAVVLVLILASANIATMFLARTSARDGELGLRRAIGASTLRQVRQLMTESVTLTAIGGLAGIVVSYWLISAVRGLGVRVLPRMDSVALDWRVALFAFGATVLMGIVGGIAPALLARRDTLRASGSRVTGARTSNGLVVAQITLSVVLVVGAGLLVKSFLRVLPSSPGFATENRATIMVSLGGRPEFAGGNGEPARRFVSDVSDRMRAVPGVIEVAAMTFLPFYGSVARFEVEFPDRPPPAQPLLAYQNIVTPNLFDVMGIPIRHGRAFTAADNGSSGRVAIVNEAAARRWWPGENPIGKSVIITERDRLTVTVVGVSGDARMMSNHTRIVFEIFLPVAQETPQFVSFIVHTENSPQASIADLKRAVWGVAPRLHIGSASDLASIAADSVRQQRFFAWAMGLFAAVALALCALGVHGLLSFTVERRRREIGIRLAMGATPGRIGASVLRRALALGVAGVVTGIAMARALSHYLESALLEVSANDASVFVGAALTVTILAVIAACAPAYRALRVEPVTSLREG